MLLPDDPGSILGLILSVMVLALAGFLAHRQWLDRRLRAADLPVADARHFARQDRRRLLGTAMMVVLAFGMSLALRIHPEASRASARLFARTWIGICALIFALLALALFDWLATRAYGRRHLRALADERRRLLEAEVRHRAVPRNGRPGPHGPMERWPEE